VTKAFYLEVCT